MLILLLSIIAIGVLIDSDVGQHILGLLVIAAAAWVLMNIAFYVFYALVLAAGYLYLLLR